MSSALPPIFVIFLVREAERRARMQKELADFDFQFIDAVDGEEMRENLYRHRMHAQWWQNGLAFRAVDPAIVRHAGAPSTIETRPKVKRSVLEHTAAKFYRWADRLHLRAARKSH